MADAAVWSAGSRSLLQLQQSGYRAESRCCTGKQGISGGERAGYGRRPDRNISVRGNGPEKVNRNKAQSLGMIWKQLLCLSRKSLCICLRRGLFSGGIHSLRGRADL